MLRRRVLRLGIVGLGYGVNVHLPALQTLDDVRVVALLGHSPERAQDIQARTRIETYTGLAAFLDQELDAVTVAVPPGEVSAIVGAALQHGIPVLCEKPLGTTTQIAQTLAQLGQDLTTAIGFQYGGLDTFRAAVDLVHSRRIGGIRHVEIIWLTQSLAHRRRTGSWKTDSARDGGVINLFASHIFYQIEAAFGPAKRVLAHVDCRASSALAREPSDQPAEDFIHAIVEHVQGTIVSMTIGNATAGHFGHRWVIAGESGTAVLENLETDPVRGFSLVARDAEGRVVQAVREAQSEDGRVESFKRLAQRFLNAVRDGQPCRPDFRDGARVQQLIDAARRSAAAQKWIEIANPGR